MSGGSLTQIGGFWPTGPTPAISIDNASGSEGAGNIVFTITQSAVSGTDTTFEYSTADGTAKAPGDYTAASNAAGPDPGRQYEHHDLHPDQRR